jgi:hypothetical protein
MADPVSIAVIGAGATLVGAGVTAAATIATLAYPIAKDAVKAIKKREIEKVRLNNTLRLFITCHSFFWTPLWSYLPHWNPSLTLASP